PGGPQTPAPPPSGRSLRPDRRRAREPAHRLLPEARAPAAARRAAPLLRLRAHRGRLRPAPKRRPLLTNPPRDETVETRDAAGRSISRSRRGVSPPSLTRRLKERTPMAAKGGPLHAWHGHFEAKRVPEGVWMRC